MYFFLFRPDKIEPLGVPENCLPGTRLTFDGEKCIPDVELNPKKKVWEKFAKDLKTNEIGQAKWKDLFLLTPSGEKLISKLSNCEIR